MQCSGTASIFAVGEKCCPLGVAAHAHAHASMDSENVFLLVFRFFSSQHPRRNAAERRVYNANAAAAFIASVCVCECMPPHCRQFHYFSKIWEGGFSCSRVCECWLVSACRHACWFGRIFLRLNGVPVRCSFKQGYSVVFGQSEGDGPQLRTYT